MANENLILMMIILFVGNWNKLYQMILWASLEPPDSQVAPLLDGATWSLEVRD